MAIRVAAAVAGLLASVQAPLRDSYCIDSRASLRGGSLTHTERVTQEQSGARSASGHWPPGRMTWFVYRDWGQRGAGEDLQCFQTPSGEGGRFMEFA